MTGTNTKGNKQVGFVTNSDEWDRAMLVSKDPRRNDAPNLSSFLRTKVAEYLETYERPEDVPAEETVAEQPIVQSGRRRAAKETAAPAA